MKSKAEFFPLTLRILGRVPTREELYWTRDHLIRMTEALNTPINPYLYMQLNAEGVKLRSIVGDLNRDGDSLWPVRLTTNARIAAARSALKKIRSNLHSTLKEYPK